MASLKINIAANLLGKLWVAMINIVMVPIYMRYLGVESYGLIGFYTTLIGVITILDFGLGVTLNRELARYKSDSSNPSQIRDLAFSLEIIYWSVGILIALVLVLLSAPIAENWVNAEQLSVDVVRQTIMMMSVVIVFQWPISLYTGGLTGLERHLVNNSISVGMNTLRAVGTIIILEYVSATIQAFFVWQSAISLIFVAMMRFALWNGMPASGIAARFSKDQLLLIKKFALGMAGISAATFFLSQIDKIVLSRLLTLSEFGYYTLAFTMASGINLFVTPLSATFFPRLSLLVKSNDLGELTKLYHKSCTLMAALIFPLCLMLIFFAEEILLVWTRDAAITAGTYRIARILVAGSMLNALMVMPYVLILSNGWTKFTLIQNTLSSILLVPLLMLLTNTFGSIGAAVVWLCVNVGYVLLSQPLMHMRLLPGELRSWYLHDTLRVLLPPLATMIAVRLSVDTFFPGLKLGFVALAAVAFVTFSISILSTRDALAFLKQLRLNFLGSAESPR